MPIQYNKTLLSWTWKFFCNVRQQRMDSCWSP